VARSDKPTTNDRLGFAPYVDGVASLVWRIEPEDLPATIGIYGAWGSGKSSFMMQVKSQLHDEARRPLPTVWFDAWKYDRTHDVRSALIFTILAKLREEARGRAKTKLTHDFQRVIEASKRLALRTQISAGVNGVGLALPSIDQLISNIDEADNFRTSVDCLAEGFAGAVSAHLRQYKETERQKLVIFVDDLDRCLPENMIIILEALKLFLDKAPCVFVIGVDRRVVEKAIQFHYGFDPGISGREYLDKIIHYSFTVPDASPVDLKRYFVPDTQSLQLNDTCCHVFEVACEDNPRIYLRLISAWELIVTLAEKAVPGLWNDSNRHLVAIATAVGLRWPALYEAGRINPRGFYTFADCCINPPAQGTERVLEKHNSAEYLSFWKDPTVRNFLSNLGGTVLGRNASEILESPSMVKAALEHWHGKGISSAT
jgi:hypothetical protein